MTVGVGTFRGERLREARLARGLVKKSLADMIGLSGWAITRYEEGHDKPRADNLAALARQLRFPEEFFLREEWPERIELVFWRSRSSETRNAREMTEQRMRWLCEIFWFLEEDVDFPSLSLPELDLPSDFQLITPEMVERTAETVRASWKIRDLPIPDMTLALENIGIPVVNIDIVSDKQDGFCFWSSILRRPFVGINKYNVSAARARFDACHELGHILMHGSVTPQQSRDPSASKLLEQQAHRFAGALLFPREAFISAVGAVTLDYFSALKKTWGMSIAAMIFRAYDLGLIDDSERTALYQNMTRRRWRGPLREPFDNQSDMPLERPRMLRRGLEAVLQAGIFGRSAFRSAVALPQGEIEQLVGVEQGFLDEAGVAQLPVSARRSSGFKAVDLESGNVLEFPQRQKDGLASRSG
jgi:Zn-dependent peptidase ImmA (M78 family)/transcriptional regulator with XRE-family HTH domain